LYVAMTRARDRLIMTYAKENPEKKLWDFAYRMDVTPRKLLTSDVSCAGDWVLLAALLRPEAVDFYRNAVRPACDEQLGDPWLIHIAQANVVAEETVAAAEQAVKTLSAESVDKISRHLTYSYPHMEATLTPSKQTATQLKGRQKDKEAAENTRQTSQYRFRKPSFVAKTEDATTYGNLMHSVMERLDFSRCKDISGIKEEVLRLVQEGFLAPEQEALVDVDAVYKFLATELGRKISSSSNVLREFKFSILDDATRYGGDLQTEQILLQGVVDCALIESDGITVVDFKTDRVTADTIPAAAERYRVQVQTYADALHRIYGLPIKERLLYFFAADQSVAL
jgi:ATP-dependent helicase/nuclease subunit A